MAKKKSVQSELGVKPRGIFDHLKHLREEQNPNYFDTLSAADKKSWSNYMVCRFLSMQPSMVEIVSDALVYTELKPEQFYKVCLSFVPMGRVYYPYIKGRKDIKWKTELIELMCKHFQESERNIREYLEIMPPEELRGIIEKYGYSEKESASLIKPKSPSDD